MLDLVALPSSSLVLLLSLHLAPSHLRPCSFFRSSSSCPSSISLLRCFEVVHITPPHPSGGHHLSSSSDLLPLSLRIKPPPCTRLPSQFFFFSSPFLSLIRRLPVQLRPFLRYHSPFLCDKASIAIIFSGDGSRSSATGARCGRCRSRRGRRPSFRPLRRAGASPLVLGVPKNVVF